MDIFFFFIFDEDTDTTVPVSVEEDIENSEELEFFFDDKVRKVWHKQEEEWYFSIVDVCQVLTDSPNPQTYWRVLKKRLIGEGNETVTNCNALKMKAVDGKMRKTDCASTEQLLRIIQSIPSKKAEPFKQWLKHANKKRSDDFVEEAQNSYTESLFESIKHINEYGEEFWYARELSKVLEYKDFRNFELTIIKAMEACQNSCNVISDHFGECTEMVPIGSNAKRGFPSYQLSRYACYLIVMNGDSTKKIIALGQTYFAVKTRQQELIDNFDSLSADQKRLAIRYEMSEHNKLLVDAAKNAGVETSLDYAIFQNHGYQGLYGGMSAKDIHQHKGLKKNQKILDHMGYEELAANLFRATQTEAKLRRDNIQGKSSANKTHYTVGKEIRDTISRLGGTMPEDLPTPEKSIQQIEKEQKLLSNK